jgi:hypothetical protein
MVRQRGCQDDGMAADGTYRGLAELCGTVDGNVDRGE